MYRSIIVPLDGSIFSEHALPLASHLATRSGATLQLVQVEAFVTTNISAHAALHAERRPEERTYLDRVVQRLTQRGQLTATAALLDGPVVDTLVQFVADQRPDLIVMTTHGHSGLRRAWFGSVAEALTRLSHVPVLLIRPTNPDQPARAWQPPDTLRHIAIALDGSVLSEQILPAALALGELTQASSTLLQVVEPPATASSVAPQERVDELQAAAQRYLDGVAQPLRAAGRQIQTRVLVNPSVVFALGEDAAEHNIDAFAMATHARTGIARLLMGSLATAMLHDTMLPLLLYRPHEHGDSAAPRS